MINFNKDSTWDLKPISLENVRSEVAGMLTDGEQPICAFKTIRDQIIFTNKRIIAIDVQGVTGTRKSYTSMPYSRIQFYSIQTPRIMEVVPDSELQLMFSNGFTATFEFKGNVDIIALNRIISTFALK